MCRWTIIGHGCCRVPFEGEGNANTAGKKCILPAAARAGLPIVIVPWRSACLKVCICFLRPRQGSLLLGETITTIVVHSTVFSGWGFFFINYDFTMTILCARVFFLLLLLLLFLWSRRDAVFSFQNRILVIIMCNSHVYKYCRRTLSETSAIETCARFTNRITQCCIVHSILVVRQTGLMR